MCCAALLPPAPPPAVGGAKLTRDSCEQPVTSFTLREEPDLSAALLSLSTSTTTPPPPPRPLSSSSPPSCRRSQNDAGGVYHGGIRCPRSRPTGGGGHLGALDRPLPTSPNSQTGGRSVSLTGCFWFCVLVGLVPVPLAVCRSELFLLVFFCCRWPSHLSSLLILSLLLNRCRISTVFRRF